MPAGGDQLRASLANQMPGFPLARIRVISAVQQTASQFWAMPAAAAGRRLQSTPYYVLVRIGLELAFGVSVATATDLASLDGLILRIKATARGEQPGLALTVPYVPTRSTICRVPYSGDCHSSSSNATLLFSATPPPFLPPTQMPSLPPGIVPPSAPIAPPAPSLLLYWLIPTCIVGGLLLLFILVLNSYCIMRLLHPARASARVVDSLSSPYGGGKVTIGDRRARRRAGGDGDGMSTPDGEEDDDDEGQEAEEEEEDAEEESSERTERSANDHLATGAHRSALGKLNHGGATGAGGGGGQPMTSPRSRQWMVSQGRAHLSYEPPSNLTANARLVKGPMGKPTWSLPPITPHSAGARRAVPPPRFGFVDSAPPENRLDRVAMAPPALGPAPWIPALSPQRRGGPAHLARRAQVAPLASIPIQQTPSRQAPQAEAAGPMMGGGGAAARARMRGNLRAAQQAATGGGAADGSPPMTPAAAAEATGMAPTPAQQTPPMGQHGVSFAPKLAEAKPRTAAVVASVKPGAKDQGGPQGGPQEGPQGGPEASVKPGAKGKGGKKSSAAADAGPPDGAGELALAGRARERVRARREGRARSEAPP